jgi:multiple sugar transport system permease protein
MVQAKRKNKISRTKREEYVNAYVFIAPALIVVAAFSLFPALRLLFMSVNSYGMVNGKFGGRFAGLANFKWIIGDDLFWKSLWNSFYFPLVITPIQTAVALGMAMLLARVKRFRDFFRTVYFFPVVLSFVIVAAFWKQMMNTDFGVINQILRSSRFNAIPFLTSVNLSKPSIAFVAIWKSWAWYMLIFMSALNGISAELYEAASIDGANSAQRFFSITLPMLRNTFLFVIIISTMNCIKLFTPIMVMTDGGPANSSRVIVHYIWSTAFMYNDYGSAAAMSVILFGTILIISVIQFRVINSRDQD